jgi:hypothetical protein
MKFTIDPAFVTEVLTYRVYSYLENPKDPTPADLIKILKGTHQSTTHGSDDHPEFAKLREMLGEQGYIKIERGWWNGDQVIKPFTLNTKKFKVGDQFFCGAAMSYHLRP